MLVFGPVELREEVTAEFKNAGVPHEPWVLGTHSADSGSVAALMVAVGSATALATSAILAWLGRHRGNRKVSILLVDRTGKREQIEVESPEMKDLALLLAQAREIALAKLSRMSRARC